MISRYCVIAGAIPYLALGLAHALSTPFTIEETKGLSPGDRSLSHAMVAARLRLTGRTNMWLAWVGFNLSHSLGAVLFGAVLVIVARSEASFVTQAAVILPMAIVVSTLYLVLGAKYWFRTPIVGIALATFLLVAGYVIYLTGR